MADLDVRSDALPSGAQVVGEDKPVDRRLVFGGLLMVLLLSALDGTIVSTAMPTIVGKFGGFDRFTWVTTAYIVTSTITSLLFGKLSDLYGRRRLMLWAIGLFVLGSALCGAAQSMTALIVFRAFQGIGGGGIMTLVFASVGDLVPPRERGKYFGLFTGVFAIASVAGPLLGGVIVDNVSWRWIFYVNVPLGALAAALLWRTLKLPAPERRGRLDPVGAVLLVLAIGALMITLEQGASRGWTSPTIIGGLVLALLLTAAFIARQRTSPEPILPLRLFADPVVSVSMLLGLLVGATMMSSSLFFALYFQDVAFMSPTMSGLATIPVMIGVLVNSTLTGRLISKWGRYRIFPIVGMPLGIAGFALLGFVLDVDTPYLVIALGMLLVGLSAGLSMPTTSVAAQNAAPFADMGIVTAALSFFRNLGSAVNLAVAGVILNASLTSELSSRLPERPAGQLIGLVRDPDAIQALDDTTRAAVTQSITVSITHVFWLMIVLSVLALGVSFLLQDRALRETNMAPPVAE